jgi:hypothetical protein
MGATKRGLVVMVCTATVALVGSGSARAGTPSPEADILFAAGTTTEPCCGNTDLWVSAWTDAQRGGLRGDILFPAYCCWGYRYWPVCLNVQGREAAVVGEVVDPIPLFIKLRVRDNGRRPDELISISYQLWTAPDCSFVPGQPAERSFSGDVALYDAGP